MAKRIQALITPEVLKWAREDAGFALEEAAKAAQVPAGQLQRWERGDAYPTLNQLRKLANKYKRPLAVFYLPKPPKDFQAMRDFRRATGESAGPESPPLRLAVRRAAYRRDVAIDLHGALGEEIAAFGFTASPSDDAEEIAVRLRSLLQVTLSIQAAWKTPHEVFNRWRALVEALGVLVFQFPGVDIDEARGFSIAENPLPVIAVNIRDSPRARAFSVLHELVHVALRAGGLCDFQEGVGLRPDDQRIEAYCNRVAGAVLVPRRELIDDLVVRQHGRSAVWADAELRQLSERFGASREAVLRRLLIMNRTTASFYQEKRREFQREYQRLREASEGGPTPDRKALSQVGPSFARLVLAGYNQERITSSRVSDYLEVRLNYLPKIEALLALRAVRSSPVSGLPTARGARTSRTYAGRSAWSA